LNEDFKKDVKWFQKHMASTNGIHLLNQDYGPKIIVQVDSCTTGAGALCENQAYHHVFSQQLQEVGICQLECVNALAAVRLWGATFKHKHVILQSDNEASVAVLQAGRGRDLLLQAVAREIWLLSAYYDFHISFEHVSGVSLLNTADALSRLHTSSKFKVIVNKLCADKAVTLVTVTDKLFQPPKDW
jgi:hypothetical protein